MAVQVGEIVKSIGGAASDRMNVVAVPFTAARPTLAVGFAAAGGVEVSPEQAVQDVAGEVEGQSLLGPTMAVKSSLARASARRSRVAFSPFT